MREYSYEFHNDSFSNMRGAALLPRRSHTREPPRSSEAWVEPDEEYFHDGCSTRRVWPCPSRRWPRRVLDHHDDTRWTPGDLASAFLGISRVTPGFAIPHQCRKATAWPTGSVPGRQECVAAKHEESRSAGSRAERVSSNCRQFGGRLAAQSPPIFSQSGYFQHW